jgi:hypothetical protein
MDMREEQIIHGEISAASVELAGLRRKFSEFVGFSLAAVRAERASEEFRQGVAQLQKRLNASRGSRRPMVEKSLTPLAFLRRAAFEPYGFVTIGRGGASRHYAHTRAAAEALRREEIEAGAACSAVLYCGT